MKKLILFLFLAILLLLRHEDMAPTSGPLSKAVAVDTSVQLLPLLKKNQRTSRRTPAQFTAGARSRPKSFAGTFVPDKDFNVGKGHILAKDLGAILKEEYTPDMGQLISEDSRFSYFKKAANSASAPVAYNASQRRFYPISKILNVKGVDSELRGQLHQEGYLEYHYIKNIKLLFLESTPSEVMKTYEELKARGLKVQLEVLTNPPKSR